MHTMYGYINLGQADVTIILVLRFTIYKLGYFVAKPLGVHSITNDPFGLTCIVEQTFVPKEQNRLRRDESDFF